MKNKISKKIAVATASALITTETLPLSIIIHAEEGDGFTITYDKTTKSLVSEQDTLFDVSGAMPGDEISKTISIKNISKGPVSLYFKINDDETEHSEKTNKLMESMLLKITVDLGDGMAPNVVFNGTVKEVLSSVLTESISLGEFAGNANGSIKMELTIPSSLNNNYALSEMNLKWQFSSKDDYSPVAPPPIITPEEGQYTNLVEVSIETSLENGIIRYTTDGTDPDDNSEIYKAPFVVDENTVVKAITTAEDYENSSITQANYDIKVSNPVISPESKQFLDGDDTHITITTETTGATIYYTTDGTTPTSSSTKYTGPFTLSKNTTVKAVAVKPNTLDSDIVSEYYTVKNAAPEITPHSKNFLPDDKNEITITTSTPDATIYYTIDGSVPTKNSLKYTNPFSINENTTVKAIAIKPDSVDSDITTESYTIKNATPIITPSSKDFNYNDDTTITITCNTSDAIIYYTTDGTTPNKNSNKYISPFKISENSIIKAIAIKTNTVDSDIATENYTVKVAPPVITPKSQQFEYDDDRKITITSATTGATIYYTTDGSVPTEKSNKYIGPFEIDKNTTVKAIAIKPKQVDSDIITETYSVVCSTPQIVPSSKIFSSIENKNITITCNTPNATIYYTTDGSTPTQDSNKYTSPFEITENTTIKAIAIKDNLKNSSIAKEEYKIKLQTPEITPKSKTFVYGENTQITITSKDDGDIYYTTDGSSPTKNSSKYTGPFEIDKNTTVKAVAIKDNMLPSDIITEKYLLVVSTPVISPESQQFEEKDNKEITITCDTPNAIIYYTTDGSTPTKNSNKYEKPFTITENTTVKAIAIKEGLEDSKSISEKYTVKLTPPEITPKSQVFESEKNATITITSTTPDGKIYYTTDGSSPTEKSNLYTKPFNISENTTVKAIVVKENCENSEPAMEKYSVTVATPKITPESQIFESTIDAKITISCDTPKATIYYTTDGSIPTINSKKYTGEFTIDKNSTIKAIAIKANMNNSKVATESYKVKAASPKITPESGTYYGEIEVKIESPDGGKIYYTLDGSTPNENNLVYTKPFKVDKTTTVSAIAIVSGKENSNVTQTHYDIRDKNKTNAPKITPSGGTYPSLVTVTIENSDPDAVIHYTIDGSTPDENSPIYTKPFDVDKNTTVNAIAISPNQYPSDVVTEHYDIQTAQPEITPKGGEYSEDITVTIKAEPGAKIYYTTDGSTPTTNSKIYTGPFVVGKNSTVTAIANKDNQVPSEPVSETYFIKSTTPNITPKGGVFDDEVTVTITAGPNAKIYYTEDGTKPDSNSKIYTGPFVVDKNKTITAIAYEPDKNPSDTKTENYQIKTAKPKISPNGNTEFDEEINVKIACSDEDAIIYYTIDGSEPTEKSNVYNKPFTVDKNTTVKAIAIAPDKLKSDTAKEKYEFKTPTPTITPVGGNYDKPVEITISCEDLNADIYYTLDGSVPNEYGTKYTGPFTIKNNVTVTAVALNPEKNISDTTSENYTVRLSSPIITPKGGEYESKVTVVISCPDVDATIRYTIDGSEPDINSPIYNGPFDVDTNTTVKAISTKIDMEPSLPVSETYSIKVAKPTITPESGTYDTPQTVVITCDTPNIEIYYTFGDGEPNILYTGSIKIDKDCSISAIAKKTNTIPSDKTTNNYIINIPEIKEPDTTPPPTEVVTGVENVKKSKFNIGLLITGLITSIFGSIKLFKRKK